MAVAAASRCCRDLNHVRFNFLWYRPQTHHMADAHWMRMALELPV
jgi:hypothetical protein